MKQKKLPFFSGAGLTSLFMVFVILCLTAFAVLSFSAVKSDWKLTNKHMQSIQSYYAADAKAQLILSEFDAKILRLHNETPSITEEELAKKLNGTVIDGITLSIAEGADKSSITFSVPAGAIQEIQVTLLPQKGENRYQVIKYKLAASQEWDGNDQPLTVWQGPHS